MTRHVCHFTLCNLPRFAVTGLMLLVAVDFARVDVPVRADAPGAPAAPQGRNRERRFELTTIDGERLQSPTVKYADQRLAIEVDGRSRAVAIDDLEQLTPVVDDTQETAAAAATRAERATQTVYLTDGGRLRGMIVDSRADGPAGFRLDAGLGDALELPFSVVAGVRFGIEAPGRADDEFARRLARRDAGRDLLLIARGGDTTVLPGAVEALRRSVWSFRVGRKVQSADYDAAQGMIFGSPASPAPAARVWLHGGDSLGGTIASADAETLVIDAGMPSRIALAWSAVARVEFASLRLVSLLDLEPVTTQTRTVLDAAWPVSRNANLYGQPLSIRGRVMHRGLGVHAHALLAYDLAGRFERFAATIGIDDAAAPGGSIIFRVKLDGTIAYESPVLRGVDPPVAISVPVGGARLMELECDPTGDLDFGDHAVWASPVLVMPRRPDPR